MDLKEDQNNEPRSAIVPTFCVSVDVLNLRSLSHILEDAAVRNRGEGGSEQRILVLFIMHGMNSSTTYIPAVGFKDTHRCCMPLMFKPPY
jgi:hypothetical protein